MVLADKIKTLDDKIKANQAQYREAAKISALTSKQLTKHDYLTGDRGVATWGGAGRACPLPHTSISEPNKFLQL